MKRKGFAITGILYVLLIIFLASMTMLLFNLQNRKMILDQLKLDVVEAVESDNNYEYLLNKISELETKWNALKLEKRENVEFYNVIASSNTDYVDFYTFTAPKDGFYIFTGSANFRRNQSGEVREMKIFNEHFESHVELTGITNWSTVFSIDEIHYMKEGEILTFSLL